MIPISSWYSSLADVSFPTVFVRLSAREIELLLDGDVTVAESQRLAARLQAAISALPYLSFVGADVCAPTDSPHYRPGKGLSSGTVAWQWLAASPKVQAALRADQTERLTVRPFRRMDKTREFRLFIHEGRLAAMSQYCLERHFARLDKRQAEIWEKGLQFTATIRAFLPSPTLIADVYLRSDGQVMLVDLNPWGPPTAPLLLRTWDRDWQQTLGLKLIGEPVTMKGDVSVSF